MASRTSTTLLGLLAICALIAAATPRIAAQPSGSPAAVCGDGKQVCATGCCNGTMAACNTFPNNTPPNGTLCYTSTGFVADSTGVCNTTTNPVPVADGCCPLNAPFSAPGGKCKSGATLPHATLWATALVAVLALLANLFM